MSGISDLRRNLAARQFNRSDLNGARFVRMRKLSEVLPRLKALPIARTSPYVNAAP